MRNEPIPGRDEEACQPHHQAGDDPPLLLLGQDGLLRGRRRSGRDSGAGVADDGTEAGLPLPQVAHVPTVASLDVHKALVRTVHVLVLRRQVADHSPLLVGFGTVEVGGRERNGAGDGGQPPYRPLAQPHQVGGRGLTPGLQLLRGFCSPLLDGLCLGDVGDEGENGDSENALHGGYLPMEAEAGSFRLA